MSDETTEQERVGRVSQEALALAEKEELVMYVFVASPRAKDATYSGGYGVPLGLTPRLLRALADDLEAQNKAGR